ncbi:hypothetical protein ACFLQN_03240 [Candidatus Aenigmatarchaeota archaeon]
MQKINMIIIVFLAVGIIGATAVFAHGVGAKYNPEIHEQIQEAIQAGDYETAKSIYEENSIPMKPFMTEENLPLMQELHDAMMSGDYERADEIKEELGMEYGRCNGRCGMHKMMYNRMNKNMGEGPRFVDANGDGYCDHLDKEVSE